MENGDTIPVIRDARPHPDSIDHELGRVFDQHLDDPHTEELFQGRGAHSRRDVEHAVVGEQAVGHESMDVTIVAHVAAEGMNGHDHAELAGGAIEVAAQKLEQALVGDTAELLQELAVVAKVEPQHDGQAESVLRVEVLPIVQSRSRGIARYRQPKLQGGEGDALRDRRVRVRVRVRGDAGDAVS